MSDATTATGRPNAVPAPSGEPGGMMTHKQILVVFSGLMLGILLAALDQTIVSTALWTIVKDLDPVHGLAHMSWVVTAYLLGSTAVTPLYGKLSDLYGRKPMYLTAIVIFLAGSALCGLSQNMGELIAFRGLQGLGGGGLMALTFAIIGDVVSPRERGKYQGYFGGVFMLAMVGGPLIGGFFTDRGHLFGVTGWRWIFYVNLPIGIVALFVVSAVLKVKTNKLKHRIDYVGAALIVAGVCALLLVTEWGGAQYAWGSATILGLIAVGVALLVAFVLWEFRASEPILPMYLFRNSIFSVANTIAFILGLALMGSLVYVSLYLQLVDGYTPTKAGLALLPMMGGILVASIGSGRTITKIGRYKVFPVAGLVIGTVGMFLMSKLNEHTSATTRGLYMAILGFGIGLVMQVLVLAVQNSVQMKDMGTATSANTFFRTMGSAFGTAIFGAILTNRINHYLGAASHGRASSGSGTPNPAQIKSLPVAEQHLYIHSFVQATSIVFLTAAAAMALGWVLSWFLKEIRLTTGADRAKEAAAAAEAAPTPVAH